MATKVLVFESDAAFAGELRNELGKLGCVSQVVDDGNVGLQQAAAEKPDLILLSIELPRMNGFSVCNKLKKDPALKDVPLIIMSSDSSEETFEQHRKLRTRAEDYVHKPIAFGELLQHIQTFVPLASEGHPYRDGSSEGVIVIDDDIGAGVELEDEGTQTALRASQMPGSKALSAAPPALPPGHSQSFAPPRPAFVTSRMTPVPPLPPQAQARHNDRSSDRSGIDRGMDAAEVDAFAESAFGRLTSGSPNLSQDEPTVIRAPASQPVPTMRASVPPPPASAKSAEVRTSEAVRSELPQSRRGASIPPPSIQSVPPRPSADQAEMERMRAELERSRARVSDLERDLGGAKVEMTRLQQDMQRGSRSDADSQKMQREIDELRAKLATTTKGGGATSSREILDLREALNRKDKEILALKEGLTRKDKDIVEIQDRLLAFEREKADLDDKILATERELADARDRIDILSADKDQAKKASEDFKNRLTRAQTEIDNRSKELEELRLRHEGQLAERDARVAELKAEHEAAAEHAAQTLAATLADAEARFAAEREDLARDHEEKTRENEEAAEQAKASALAALEADLRAEKAKALADAKAAEEAALAKANDEARALLDETVQRMQGELAAAEERRERQLADAESRRNEQLAAAEARRQNENDAAEALRKSQSESAAREREEAIEQLTTEHATLVAALRSELETKVRELTQDRDERVGAANAERDQRVAELTRDRDESVAAALQDRDARVAAAEADRDARVAAAEANRDESVAQANAAREAQVRELEAARDARIRELEVDRDARLEAQAEEGRARVAELEAEHDARIKELEAKAASELAAAHAQAEAQKAEALRRTTNLEEAIDGLRRDVAEISADKDRSDAANAATIADLQRSLEQMTQARDNFEQELVRARAQIAALDVDVLALRADLDEVKRKFNAEARRADHAFAKWESDRNSLERAKDALAVALSQIEEAEERPIAANV